MSDPEPIRCPEGHKNPATARFCARCGKPVETDTAILDLGPRTASADAGTCANGPPVPDGDGFCPSCGSARAGEPMRSTGTLSVIDGLGEARSAVLAACVVLVLAALVFALTRRTSAPSTVSASPPPASAPSLDCSAAPTAQLCQSGYSPMPPKAGVTYLLSAAPRSRRGNVTVHFHDAGGKETRTVSLPWSHFATLGVREHAYLRAESTSPIVIPVCEIDE